MDKEFLKSLKEKRESYKDMIDFCCDSLILNNYIMEELQKKETYFDLYCGDTLYYIDNNGEEITRDQAEKMKFDEYSEEYKEFYQYYIINEQDAERLAEYTNEVVFFNDDLNLYILAVDHCGTAWSCVPANWKEAEEIED